jgi:hypothetical protein
MTNNTKLESCKTELCQYDSATLTRFYDGMLLTAEYLRQEQAYHREALRRVNRYLFGSGIICGLEVKPQVPSGLCLTIHPGVALDCCGNLIEVCKCITMDLMKECKDEYGSDCINPTQNPADREIKKYLVLRYDEKLTDPEPVLTPAEDCKPAGDKPNCEASKIREGFCIELWDKCPCDETPPAPGTSLKDIVEESDKHRQAALAQRVGVYQPTDPLKELLPCSPCGCCESAVGLAELTIHCDTRIVEVNMKSCRRNIISLRFVRSLLFHASATWMKNVEESLDPQLVDRSAANAIAMATAVEQLGADIYEIRQEIARMKKARQPSTRQSSKRTTRTSNP